MSDPSTFPLASQPLTEPQALAPGSVIAGKYCIDGELGAGGMGVVLSARHLDLEAPVAIKVMRDELAGNEEVVARMLFEARAAAQMRSAHVVRVLDVGRLESGAPYIVMERLEGRDLAQELVQRGPLSVEQAVDYVLQACEGLAEAHAAGIVHRDLKPENLFLADTPEGRLLKILDFGISKSLGPTPRLGPRSVLTNAGCSVGSPYYMSPEQMRGSAAVDARSDIWSLGAILHELLTGDCPFNGESIPVVCSNVLNLDPPELPPLAWDGVEQLQAIIRRCLEKDPARRFQSVAELATALREVDALRAAGSAERSPRCASGVDFKRKGAGRHGSGTPVTLLSRTAACSSPTLPVPVVMAAAPEHPARPLGPRLTKPRRRGLGIAVSVAVVALGTCAGIGAWQGRVKEPIDLQRSSGNGAPEQVRVVELPRVERKPIALAATPASAPSVASAPSAPRSAAPAFLPAPAKQVRWAKGFVRHPRAATRETTLQDVSAAPVAVEAPPSSVPPAPPAPASNPDSSSAAEAANPETSPASRSAWDGDRLGGRY
jgi:serine/threonine-protein kinase